MSGPEGLQAERTAMAWQRTALGLGGVSALLLHHAGGKVTASIPGVAGLLAALGMLLLVEARYLRRDRGALETSPMGIGAVRAVATVTVLIALSAAVVVLVESG
jgi:putative membrane protein